MEGILGKVTGMLGGGGGGGGGGVLDMVIGQAFGMFDTDKSGYVEGPELNACVERVLAMAGINNVPPSAIDSVFNRVAGPDQKLDKAEFTKLVHQLLAQQDQSAEQDQPAQGDQPAELGQPAQEDSLAQEGYPAQEGQPAQEDYLAQADQLAA